MSKIYTADGRVIENFSSSSDFLNLSGNLKLKGNIMANKFTDFEGKELTVVGSVPNKMKIEDTRFIGDIVMPGEAKDEKQANGNLTDFGYYIQGNPKKIVADPDYYKNKDMGTYYEFKFVNPDHKPFISGHWIPNKTVWGVVNTIVPWADYSGGGIKQIIYTDVGIFYRTGTNKIWNDPTRLGANTTNTFMDELNKVKASIPDYTQRADFNLGNNTAADRGPVGFARALVRDANSQLTINYDNDFKGGVNIGANGGLRINGNTDIYGVVKANEGIALRGGKLLMFNAPNDTNGSDPYYLNRVQEAGDNNRSSLRLTLNDDPDESFQIWGNSCGEAGGCGGAGVMKHRFDALGNAEHKGIITTDNATNQSDPTKSLRVSANSIIFGGPNEGRESNSAQISAGMHHPDSLNIVGMSTGKEWKNRKIDMWAEGGLKVYGGTAIAPSSLNEDERNKIIEWGRGLHIKNASGAWTHFDWHQDGRNYIRGNTRVDGQLCLGNTCIDENDFKRLIPLKRLAGFGIDGNATTIPLYEGVFNLDDKWVNKKIDTIFVNRGWKIEIYDNNNANGLLDTKENKDNDIPITWALGNNINKAQSYRATWVGY